MHADKCLDKCLLLDIHSVLDVGSGTGIHANEFQAAGKDVTTISMVPTADHIGDYLDVDFAQAFDLVWASHVLEHQPNPNQFLKKCYRDIKDGGYFAVTVPPWKPQIVGGHLNFYNAGLLLYHLIMAGFDCSKAMVKTYGYNISVIVQKRLAKLEGLHMDSGDIDKLAKYFPLPVRQGFDGNIAEVNW